MFEGLVSPGKHSPFINSAMLSIKLIRFRYANRQKDKYKCPICRYYGPFKDLKNATGDRLHANCPRCGSMERHRLQKLVLDKLSTAQNFSNMKLLHFAPEPYFVKYFQQKAGLYVSIDLNMQATTLNADILKLPFKDSIFDFVFASHVLEHVKDDHTALSEIRRVLTDQGVAILPVPIVAERTIEYPEPNPFEAGHVRAPAPDYFQRFRHYFSHVDLYSSGDFSAAYQTFIFEKRDHWPTDQMPLRKPMTGTKHSDFVPVCMV